MALGTFLWVPELTLYFQLQSRTGWGLKSYFPYDNGIICDKLLLYYILGGGERVLCSMLQHRYAVLRNLDLRAATHPGTR